VSAAKLTLLFVRMLRYRVAMMILMFMSLGAAAHGGLRNVDLRYVWATASLAAGYVAATTVNDVADRDIDAVNHPGDRGRPLITGEATVHDLLVLHVVALVSAVALAAPLGWPGVAIMAGFLIIGEMYSVGPLRLSYRTYLAPLALAVPYVLIPYALGLVVVRSAPEGRDIVLCGGLFVLFVARINLKDFRDREGDGRYGKPTLLLRFGKGVTCLVSIAALVAADVLLMMALRPPSAVALALQFFVIAIGFMLRRLWLAAEPGDEQVSIGLGARMGNGLLLTALTWLILMESGAPPPDRVILPLLLAAGFAVQLVVLASRPEDVLIGYKG
jgi:4-hydroxybenzoate polyprenyltransferase